MKLLLIGMGPGMGMSIAKAFGKKGCEILMVARNNDKLANYSAELTAEGIRSYGYTADLTNTAAFELVLNAILKEHPAIDILHYNASAFNPAIPSELDLNVFLNDFKTGVVGAVQAIKAVLPGMKERKSGSVFLTGGGTAFSAPPELSSLGVSKAAMRNLAFSIAGEAAPHGIRVSTVTVCGMIAPGSYYDPDKIATAFVEQYEKPLEEVDREVVFKES